MDIAARISRALRETCYTGDAIQTNEYAGGLEPTDGADRFGLDDSGREP